MAKIHKAARKGDVAGVGSILDAGEDINACEKLTGATPLHMAAGNDHLELMRYLIGRGADLRAQASFGTPLHWTNSPAAARVLLDAGVEVDIRSKGGVTPLVEAARGPGKPEMVRFLLDAGADPAAASDKGETALDIASGAEVIAMLQAAGGTRHATTLERWVDAGRATTLARAVRGGDTERVRRLLAEGSPPDGGLWAALVGVTPTPFAEVATDRDIVEWIVAGSRIDAAYSELARLLVEAGADANARTEHGLTAHGREKRWAHFPPIVTRTTYSPTTAIGMLFTPADEPAIVDAAEPGFTPLHVAAMSDDATLVEALVAHSADVNARSAGGETPLHLAVLYVAPYAAAALLAARADVSARTTDAGETPLAWASRWTGHTGGERVAWIAERLREYGGTG